ncbi:MAG: cob(I)yrinic acid a,c-diamide adenosyltransferase [Thermomicrobiales bacterium]
MRLYTGKGDQGATDLLGERVGKDDPRIGLIGSLDEATSQIGLGRAVATAARTKEWLTETQRDLYRIMAELAFTEEIRPEQYVLPAERVTRLEALTDQLSADVPLPPHFILPGDTLPGAALDVARAVVRRAEREAVALANAGIVTNPEILRYLNRLSSLLFMLARYEDREAGVTPLRAKERA